MSYITHKRSFIWGIGISICVVLGGVYYYTRVRQRTQAKQQPMIPPGVYKTKQKLYGIEVDAQIKVTGSKLSLNILQPIKLVVDDSEYNLVGENIIIDDNVVKHIKNEKLIELRSAKFRDGNIVVTLHKWLDFKLVLSKM